MSTSESLLPCPFCGGAAMVFPRNCDKDTPYNPADRGFPIVRCRSCGADAAGDDWKGPETAVAKWNRRVPEHGPTDFTRRIGELLAKVPQPPDSITYESGWKLLNELQDIAVDMQQAVTASRQENPNAR